MLQSYHIALGKLLFDYQQPMCSAL
jgi:hypothetical protein